MRHVISLSLGGAPNILPFSIGSGRSSGDAANEAIDAGIYVVAAAGNDGEDDDGDVAHPSSEAGVISVGGVTLKGTHWPGSSKGDNNGRLLPLPILMPRGDPTAVPAFLQTRVPLECPTSTPALLRTNWPVCGTKPILRNSKCEF